MEINMMQHRHPLSLPQPRAVPLPVLSPAERPAALPRLARYARAVLRTGITSLRWLSRLGTGRIDVAALEKARGRSYSLRIRSIGH